MRSDQEVENAFALYGDMIRRVCFVHLKKEADVEDIFQNVFFKYSNDATDFTSSEHEKAWLLRVSINECKSLLQRWFRRKVELSDDLSIYGLASSSNDVKEHSLLYEVLKLPDNYKNVIYLFYYEGYKTKEIAEILHVKDNTVSTWLSRGKEQLKTMLGGDYLEENSTS